MSPNPNPVNPCRKAAASTMRMMAIVSGMSGGVLHLPSAANAGFVPWQIGRKNSCHQIGSQGIGIYKWKIHF